MTPPTWSATQATGEETADLRHQIDKLTRINAALVRRVERATDMQGNAFSLFETAITLETRVRERTRELEQALEALAEANAALAAARAEADQARNRLDDAINSLDEGFALFDADDRLVLANETYVSLWPEAADLIRPGTPFAAIVERLAGLGVPVEALAAPEAWVSERIARHRIAEGGHAVALADGRWVQINERRTRDGGIVGIYTDITDLKAAEARDRALEAARRAAVLQATLDAMPQGICLFDSAGKLTAWNDPLLAMLKLAGNGSPDAARLGSHDSFLGWCRLAMPALVAAGVLEWPGPGDGESCGVVALADGRSIEVHRQPMPDGGLLLRLADVTALRAAAAAMAQRKSDLEALVALRTAELEGARNQALAANASKTRFLAAASHDLLQPLNAARLFISALGSRRMADGNRALVAQAASALDSIESLLEALLEISRLDAGAIQPEIRPMPLDSLFAALTAEFAPPAEARGLLLEVASCPRWVETDPRLLRRILQNFLSNAIRYTRRGKVGMTADTTADGTIRISVTDTGPGIAEADQTLIFEEFRRLAPADGEEQERGIGLGLAIVQRAARTLGAPIGLDSRLGEGSCFWVEVPAARSAGASAGASAGGAAQAVSGADVLVIDNEPAILAGMAALLAGWSCHTRTARNRTEAFAAIAASPPDLVLADYHLADGITGDRLVAELRGALGAELPAAIITADRTPELREALGAAGLAVLTKPIKPAQLRALIGRLARTSPGRGAGPGRDSG